MKIALIGYGAMGRLIGTLAEGKGHEIAFICRSPRVSKGDTFNVSEGETSNLSDTPTRGLGQRGRSGETVKSDVSPLLTRGLAQSGLVQSELSQCDVAIDFSSADAVRRNVEACLLAGIPIVEGTTGWNSERDEIDRIVRDVNGAMVFGANFSIGVNLFYRVAEFTAELFAKFSEYEAFIEEQHHSRKKDSPSGTALKLEEIVSERLLSEDADRNVRVPDADKSVRAPSDTDRNVRVPISATRAGNIPGTHRVGFDGPADQILLEHTARSREGFALGAIMAAEWIIGKKGFYEFADIMDEILAEV